MFINFCKAEEIGALAYAQGTDIHFAPGQYHPETQEGQKLIGHELTHMVQQKEGRVSAKKQGAGLPINDDPGLEKEADEMGAKAAQGKMADVNGKGGSVQREVNETGLSKGDWDHISHELRSELFETASNLIDEIQNIGNKVANTEKAKDQLINTSDIAGLILGAIPQAAPFKDLILTTTKSLCNFNKSLSTKNMSFNDYYDLFKAGLEGFVDDVTPHRDLFLQYLKNNSSGKTRKDIEKEIREIGESFPSRMDLGRAFIFNWIGSAKDVDGWLPDLLQVEGDYRDGKKAGYIKCRMFRNVGLFNHVNWSIQDLYFDDISLPDATNELIGDLYGSETSIFDLPFEVQLDIDSISPPGYQLSGSINSNSLALIKNQKTEGTGLDLNPSYQILYGNKSLLASLKESGQSPKVKDLKND